MKKKNYLYILVSGGLNYLTGIFAKEIGADDFIGMKIKTKSGAYTNKLENDVRTEKGKDKEVKRFLKKYKSSKELAIGLGDSPQDAAIFKNTKKIVALNPNSELKKLAIKNNWFIANNKNIIRVMNNCFNKGKIKCD
jgi:phosphoserine phosphatase